MTALLTIPPPPSSVPQWQGFVFGTISAPLAVVFTNPFDTAIIKASHEILGDRLLSWQVGNEPDLYAFNGRDHRPEVRFC